MKSKRAAKKKKTTEASSDSGSDSSPPPAAKSPTSKPPGPSKRKESGKQPAKKKKAVSTGYRHVSNKKLPSKKKSAAVRKKVMATKLLKKDNGLRDGTWQTQKKFQSAISSYDSYIKNGLLEEFPHSREDVDIYHLLLNGAAEEKKKAQAVIDDLKGVEPMKAIGKYLMRVCSEAVNDGVWEPGNIPDGDPIPRVYADMLVELGLLEKVD